MKTAQCNEGVKITKGYEGKEKGVNSCIKKESSLFFYFNKRHIITDHPTIRVSLPKSR